MFEHLKSSLPGTWAVTCHINSFYSPCSMRQRDWCTTVVSTIGSRHSCAICTGSAFLNVSSSVWPFLCSAAVTRPHLNTSRETCSGLMTTSLADHYTIGDNSQAGCASHTTPINRWSCVRCCRTSSVERSAYRRFHWIVRRHLQTAFEDFVHTLFDVWRTVTLSLPVLET